MSGSIPGLSLEAIAVGGKKALSTALAELEKAPESPACLDLLSQAYRSPRAHVIGVTGPPGVGKSTLLGVLIENIRLSDRTVGVIAVDPSSQVSGGALLGDRVRLVTNPEDAGVYVRSMAARDRLGGLAALTMPAMVLMRGLFDVVLIETVGVGQSETEVVRAADTVLFCAQPGSGDSLQFMKAGIIEIPDIFVITKSDMGGVARRAEADLRNALNHVTGNADESGSPWKAPVLGVSSQKKEGFEELLEAFEAHWRWLGEGDRLERRRAEKDGLWLEEALRDLYGREGIKSLGQMKPGPGETPFQKLAQVIKEKSGV